MNKKLFTILLLVVFVFTQFSIASAASVAGDIILAQLPTFSDEFDMTWIGP